MKKIIISLIFLTIFIGNSFAGSNKKYVDKLLKHNIITEEQLNKGVTIKGKQGETKIIKKNGKIITKHTSKEKIKKNKERELKRKIKDNENDIDDLKEEIERIKRR